MSYTIRYGPAPPHSRMRFSGVEVRQILVAVVAMTLAFALAIIGGIYGIEEVVRNGGPIVIAFIALASFVAVVTAFLLHELAHKAVAQRYGCFAEFRYFPMGLVLGIVTGAFGFLFAMPGAVMIAGNVGPRENARISAAGPGTNIALAAGFLGLALMLGSAGTGGRFTNLATLFVGSIAFVNLFLGGFNMIPFPPLDGSKILFANKALWIGMIALLVALYYVGWRLGVF